VKPFPIALVGNPNCGKTTLFNALTGSRQKVANWPGVTVERKSGQFVVGDQSIEVVDLPGIYSLNTDHSGLDEKIARRYIVEEKPSLIVNIVDASNLNRHLLMTHELLDLGAPLILALNMIDVAADRGMHIDAVELERRLGVPVFPIVASRGQGLVELKNEIANIAQHPELTPKPKEDLLCAEESLTHRFQWIRQQTQGVVEMVPGKSDLTESIDAIVLNRWLGVPIFLFMMYLMFTVAVNVGSIFIDFFDILLGAIFVDGFGNLLSWMGSPIWIRTLLADGLGGGIQLVGTFIPVIGFLYLCLSLLEDSGYMSRAAFVVDRLMAKIGLPGNSFVPLIVGFGCNVPSVMASRTLSREQDRLLTIAMSPFMSCGARLTVYALFAAAFFKSSGSLIVFILYVFGIAMAVFTGWIFRKTLFSGQASPSIQEMPAYHIPLARNILTTTWHRLKGFLMRAGKTIVMVVTLLTIVNSVGIDGSFGNQNSKESLLSYAGKTLTPILHPIGIRSDNWPATVGIFTGIFAKEAVVGTLDALYQDVAGVSQKPASEFHLWPQVVAAFASIGTNASDLVHNLGDPLGLSNLSNGSAEQEVSNTGLAAMQNLFSSRYSVFCYLVLVLLYTPCVAVMGALNRESGPLWASLVIAWSSFLAYWCASNLYQISQIQSRPLFALSWLLGSALAMAAVVQALKQIGRRRATHDPNIIARA